MAKRFTAIILALAMALSLVTVNVFAAPEVEGYEVSKAFEPNATVTLGDWTPIAQYDTNYGIARPDVAAALAAEGAILVVEGTDTVNYLCIQANGWTNNYIGLAQTKSGDESLGNGVWNADKHYGVFDNDIVKKILAISTETWNSIVLSGSGELVGLYVCVPTTETPEIPESTQDTWVLKKETTPYGANFVGSFYFTPEENIALDEFINDVEKISYTFERGSITTDAGTVVSDEVLQQISKEEGGDWSGNHYNISAVGPDGKPTDFYFGPDGVGGAGFPDLTKSRSGEILSKDAANCKTFPDDLSTYDHVGFYAHVILADDYVPDAKNYVVIKLQGLECSVTYKEGHEPKEDVDVLYTLPADKLGEMSTGWVNVVSGAEVSKFTNALSAYGAVLTIKTDITADDIDASKGLWISICAQSTSDWATGNVPNGVVETTESGTTLTYKGSDILDFVEEKGWTGAVQFALNNSNLSVDTFELISFEVTAPKVEEEKLPDGYVADEKIEVGDDNVEVSADGKTVTVTPDDDLKTEGLLIKFDKPAPADGTVTVNYGEPEKAPEDKVLFTHEWSIESNWHSLNKKWNAADFTKLLEALQVENAVVKVEYTGDQGWGLQIGLKDGDLNKMYTVEGVKHDTATKTATVSAADVYALAAANGMDYETVDNCEFYVNTGHSEAHNLTLSVIVPAEAVPAAASLEEGETASVTASFKAGATFVVVDTSEYKDDAITSVVISVKSGKAPTVSEILVKKAKQKKQGIEGYNGYIVQLGAQYHGLFMGGPRLIPMPHTFVGDTCTACGYHKISLH